MPSPPGSGKEQQGLDALIAGGHDRHDQVFDATTSDPAEVISPDVVVGSVDAAQFPDGFEPASSGTAAR